MPSSIAVIIRRSRGGLIVHVNQGGTDISAVVRKDFSPETRIAGNAEYLSNYTYRLVFNDSYWQAINSQVKSELAWTHAHNGYVPSVEVARLQTFASPNEGNQAQQPNVKFDEVRLLHLPSVRFDVIDRPLESASSPVYWGMGSSLAHMSRSEPDFHAHNDGRIDLYPHHLRTPGRRRMEPRSRTRSARYLVLDKPGSRPDRHPQRRP